MAVPSRKVPLRFRAIPVPIFAAGYRLMERRLWLTLQFAQVRGGVLLERCLLDTGAPLCVIPYEVHADPINALKWHAVNASGPVTKYRGIDCDLGRVRVWFPNFAKRTRFGPFDLIAKFLRSPLAFPNQAVILLGLNFFEENEIGATFRYRSIGNTGEILLP